MTHLRPALVALLIFTLLLGGVYPALVTAAALALPGPSAVDASLIGREFLSPRDFWGRPSATTPPYNASASTGSNLSAGNPALKALAEARVRALQTADPANKAPIPADLVLASGSGLDPHISPEAAEWQAPRVAKARKLPQKKVEELIASHTEGPQWGVFGRPRVNVAALNAALGEAK